MIKKLIFILLLANCSLIYAQTIKTDVLVIGGTNSGIAAGIQCARSNVKTVLAIENSTFGNFPANGHAVIEANKTIHSGIWDEFRNRVKDIYGTSKGFDTSYNGTLNFEPANGSAILKKIGDSVKNLTIYENALFTTIKKDGDRWEASITQNGKIITIKAKVVIDATTNGDVATKAGAKFPAPFDIYNDNSGSNQYRTSVATGDAWPGNQSAVAKAPKSNYPPYPGYYIPMAAVVCKDVDNLLITEKVLPTRKDIQFLPLQLQLGQGVATVAAFCAFFKTTTNKLRVRIIQGEILDFNGYLLPFDDVSQKDRYWRAIQQVCATGLLKGKEQITGKRTQFVFMPDSLVSTAEVKPVLTEIYTRAFLWFNKEKPGEKFTVGNLVSLISDYTLSDPQTLNKTIQRAWKSEYKFSLDFDANRPVTRREFAILVNKYLNPFARTVDLSGRLVN